MLAQRTSEIDELATNEVNSLRIEVKELPRGGKAELSRKANVDKSTVARFAAGGNISAVSFIKLRHAQGVTA